LSGCLIKRFTGKPLVVDFRDAWALNPHQRRTILQQRLVERMESWVVQHCDALIVNTVGAERLYRVQYPAHAPKIRCIPNGFDRLNTPRAEERPTTFVVMHVGDFYGTRTPDRLLDALAKMDQPDVEFVQVGPPFESRHRYDERVRIRVIERVAREEALAWMRKASLLYLCQGFEKGTSHYIAVASKTYEYLATGLPVLADCPAGDNAELISRFATRAYVVTDQSVAAIETAIRDAYRRRHDTQPTVSCEFVRQCQRDIQVSLLANTLTLVCDSKHSTVAPSVAGRNCPP
jgi:glycosyltransferase involved in cell wall biosynthesis